VIRAYHHPVTVALLTVDDLKNLFSVRYYLEKLAVKKAVRKISSKEITLLDSFIEPVQETAIGIMEQEHNFHSLIIQCSHNSYIINAYKEITPAINRYRVMFAKHLMSTGQNSKNDHRSIYNAIKSGDVAMAGIAMKRHLFFTQHTSEEYLKEIIKRAYNE
jgi:DNA-binding GntR family transcriptional regulator